MKTLSKRQVLALHSALIQEFGGSDGVRDEGLLESALAAPFQTFGGQELYPSLLDKAARLCYGLAKNHPFRDGNKRSAVHSMLVFLYINEIELEYTQLELEEMIIAVADNRMSSDELKDWIEKRIQKK